MAEYTFDDLAHDSGAEFRPSEGDVAMLKMLAEKALKNEKWEYSGHGFEKKSNTIKKLYGSEIKKLAKYYYPQRDFSGKYSHYKGSITLVDEENQVVFNFSYEPPVYIGGRHRLTVMAARLPQKG